MKMIIIVVLAFVALAAAVPVGEVVVEPIKIIRSDYDQRPEGGYSFSFETANGINRVENGELKEALDEDNKPRLVIVVRYAYVNQDGKSENVNYYADETGYHVEGDSIPKPAAKQ